MSERPIPREVFFRLGNSGFVKGIVVHEFKQEGVILPSIDESDGLRGTKGPEEFSQVVISQVEKTSNPYKPGDSIILAQSLVHDVKSTQ